MNEDELNPALERESVKATSISSNFSDKENMEQKKKVGRPRIPDSEKAIYQRVPIRYETYTKMKSITKGTKITYTDLVESLLQESELNKK